MTIYNFAMLNVPFANGAISTEIAPFPDWNRGLGIAFDQTEGKPEMKGLNGLFQVLTTSILYLKQRGIAEWDSAIEYPANAFVTEGAKLYKSKRTNTGKQPSLSQLDWDVWASISDISVSTNGNLKKNVASDGSVTLEVPTASDSQRGAVRQATSTEVANKSNVNAYVTPANALSITNTSNADSATRLQTPRTINGVPFDGTGNITVADSTKLPLTGGTITGDLTVNTKINAPLINSSNPFGFQNSGAAQSILTGGVLTSNDYSDSNKIPLNGIYSKGKVQSNGGFVGDLEGNSASATKLQTARTIGGVAFDGTSNINLPGVNTAGNQDTSGNAATATRLQYARKINGVPFDGTANIDIPTATTSTVGTVRQATSTEVANRENVNAYVTPSSLVRKATSAEVSNGSNVDAYITPINVGQTFGESLSENGWCRLPNGLIMQWGTVGIGGGVGYFPIPFSATPFYFGINRKSTLNAGEDWDSTSGNARNSTSFNYLAEGSSANWLAIGY